VEFEVLIENITNTLLDAEDGVIETLIPVISTKLPVVVVDVVSFLVV
jgi:hypothetical protein